MNKIANMIIFFVFVLTLQLSFSHLCSADQLSIKIANGDWPPYFSPSLKDNGIVSRTVKEAFMNEGVTIEYVFRPWKRGLLEAKDGKWNGSIGWLKTKEREESFYFTKPIMNLSPIFFQRKDNPIKWNSFLDLEGRKIGATDGFFYGEEFAEAETQKIIIVDRTIDAYHSLLKLMNKRVDLAAVERAVGVYTLFTKFDENKAVQIEPQHKQLHSQPAYLLISKRTPNARELIRLFNKGLDNLTNEGIVDQHWKEFEQGNY